MKRRQEILDNQKPIADSMIDTNTRQGDLADQANGNNEVHIHLKLKQTDAKILIAIEEALQRVEAGLVRRLPRLRRRDRPGASRGHSLDARVHRLQGEAEGVTSPTPPTSTTPTAGAPSAPTQRALLQDAYRDRLALMNRHVEGATRMADYEFNNTYQYVIGREEIHVQWLRDALIDLGAEVPATAPVLAVAGRQGRRRRAGHPRGRSARRPRLRRQVARAPRRRPQRPPPPPARRDRRRGQRADPVLRAGAGRP